MMAMAEFTRVFPMRSVTSSRLPRSRTGRTTRAHFRAPPRPLGHFQAHRVQRQQSEVQPGKEPGEDQQHHGDRYLAARTEPAEPHPCPS